MFILAVSNLMVEGDEELPPDNGHAHPMPYPAQGWAQPLGANSESSNVETMVNNLPSAAGQDIAHDLSSEQEIDEAARDNNGPNSQAQGEVDDDGDHIATSDAQAAREENNVGVDSGEPVDNLSRAARDFEASGGLQRYLTEQIRVPE